MEQGKPDDMINAEVDKGRGKRAGWPTCLEYKLANGTAIVTMSGKKIQEDAQKEKNHNLRGQQLFPHPL